MSLFRRVFSLDEAPPPAGAPVDPHRPLPALTAESLPGETQSVHMIAAALGALPPARARYVAAFAYLLGRAANANLEVSESELGEMADIGVEAGPVEEAAELLVHMSATPSKEVGGAEDFLLGRRV